MTKFLIISEGGDGIGLAWRLQQEGHDVKIWIRDTETEKRGEGLVEHASDNTFGEVIVADCTGAGPLLDHMRENGSKVVGGSSLADRLEADRAFAESVMADAGIRTPASRSFSDWDSAEEFLAEQHQKSRRSSKIVFKPGGKLSGVVPSFVAADATEMLEMLEHYEHVCGRHEPDFVLQEFIEGVAVSTEGWFDGRRWLLPFNHTLERKQLMNGDLGPSGGCTGNVVWTCGADDKLVAEGIAKLEDFLRQHDYRGAIDLNSVVNEDGLFGLEFTPRFGYDAFPTYLLGLYNGAFGALLEAVARGDAPDEMDVRDGFAAGVRVTIAPWPSEKFHADEDIPVRGLTPGLEWFYPYDMKRRENKFYTAGGYGITGVAVAHGDSIGEAFAKTYLYCEQLKLPDKQHRTDLSEVFEKDYRGLALAVGERKSEAWWGVDLDGTLASYSGWSDEIGEPIQPMVNRVKRWLSMGRDVRIFTARGTHADGGNLQRVKIHEWVKQHVGQPLEVTHSKDPNMVTLYDDRVVQIEENTGKRVGA